MLDFGFYNMDCMDGMKEFPDKYFDLAIVDPPYGIDINKSGRLKKYNDTRKTWDDNIPEEDYFNALFRVSKNQIIWGGNYFYLPPTKCFLIWDKRQPENISFASCEFAWTSFNSVAKTFYMSPMIRIKTVFIQRKNQLHCTIGFYQNMQNVDIKFLTHTLEAQAVLYHAIKTGINMSDLN